MSFLEEYIRRVHLFEIEANAILSIHESSKSRIVRLEDTYKQLGGFSIKQDELFRQALRCVENSLFRAAHVMAWSGFMDFVEEKLESDGFKHLKSVRPNWKFSTIEDLREQFTEYAIIEVSRDVGMCTKSEMKALHGLLNKRNECAHPSDYFPKLNETLGYIAELLNRLEIVRMKKI